MTRDTYYSAIPIVHRIEILEVIVKSIDKSETENTLFIFSKTKEEYQKELDELNYKLYHLN